jgi:hypothetical protein
MMTQAEAMQVSAGYTQTAVGGSSGASVALNLPAGPHNKFLLDNGMTI